MRVLQVQLEIGADPAEVGRARRWARSTLAGCGIGGDEALAETLLLLISELVTNAVVHTGTPSVLRVLLPGRQAAETVRVEVVDMSTCPPRQRHADGDETSGRGLELVSGLADRWGWQREGLGKRIWCEVDRPVVAGQTPLTALCGPARRPEQQLTAGAVGGGVGGVGGASASVGGGPEGVLPA